MYAVPCAIGVDDYTIPAPLSAFISIITVTEFFRSTEERIVPQNTLWLWSRNFIMFVGNE